MCFIGPNIPKVATEDIPCYKVMLTRDIYRPKWWQFWKKTIITYRSYFRLYLYRADAVNPTIQLVPDYSHFKPTQDVTIVKGYHSYRMGSLAKKYYSYNRLLIGCIIPKGSIYFENSDEYVSSNIVVTDQLLPRTFSESDIL